MDFEGQPLRAAESEKTGIHPVKVFGCQNFGSGRNMQVLIPNSGFSA
jgi:hypothetical protein